MMMPPFLEFRHITKTELSVLLDPLFDRSNPSLALRPLDFVGQFTAGFWRDSRNRTPKTQGGWKDNVLGGRFVAVETINKDVRCGRP